MADSLIAIVGSYTAGRTYDPPLLHDAATVKQAAEDLGRELAKLGYSLMVYSSDPNYIEADVVRGYVLSGQAKPASIQVRYPQVVAGNNPPSFPEQATHGNVFDPVADIHPSWQVSFFKSLKDANGIVLLGGANSALITGLIAQMYRIPLVSIATFGGSAQTVWAISVGTLATDNERKLMNLPLWGNDSALKLVGALSSQHQRLLQEEVQRKLVAQLEERRLRGQALIAAALFIAAVVLTLLGTFSPPTGPRVFGALFFGVPLFAGAAGGIARNIFDSYRGVSYQINHTNTMVIFLGMMAGFIAALLFVVAQWASNPAIKNLGTEVPPGLNLLIPFELIVGVIAGLTLESVFASLLTTKVVNVAPVTTRGT
jgi:hypothetical protein